MKKNTPHKFSYKFGHKKNSNGHSQLEIVKQSLKTVSKEYCAESSICGLKHLVNDDTPLIERIIWVIILIIGLICSVSLVWMTFLKYYRAPLVTTQMPEGVSVSKIIFPAVGICSNNRISKRAVTELAQRLLLEERNKNYTESQMMTLLTGLGQLYDMQPIDNDMVSAIQLHHALGDYKVHQLMRNLTPRCEDLLVRCVWNTQSKECMELFDFRLTVNGYCCTFNYLRFSDVSFKDKEVGFVPGMYNKGNKSSFDFDQGLLFMLRLNESDDFFYNIPLQGAQLQFSDAYDFPDAPSGSFAMQIISPSVQVSLSFKVFIWFCIFFKSPFVNSYVNNEFPPHLALHICDRLNEQCLKHMTVTVSASFTEASRDIQHVSLKLRKCRFHDESDYLPFYTYSDCILKCRMYFLLEKCNCTPFNMLKKNHTRTCDLRDVACLRTYYAQSITIRPSVQNVPPELEMDLVRGGIYCPMCCPTCSKTDYSYDFNNVIIYPDYFNEVPDDDRDFWLRGVNFTGASIVHVKYAREVADCYEQNVIMKWFDLISNIGSTCGFVTGFSFVSVLEFIYFFTVKLFREIYARKRRKRVHTATTIEARNSGISIHRPIYWNELTQSTQYANFNNNSLM